MGIRMPTTTITVSFDNKAEAWPSSNAQGVQNGYPTAIDARGIVVGWCSGADGVHGFVRSKEGRNKGNASEAALR